jgi:hypothetical protein
MSVEEFLECGVPVMAFFEFPVTNYSYIIHTSGNRDYLVIDGQFLKVRSVIDCTGEGHHVYVIALADDSPFPPNRFDPTTTSVWIFCRTEQFLWHIDLLRNEKPVFCYVNVRDSDNRGFCSLRTLNEPVGEGETIHPLGPVRTLNEPVGEGETIHAQTIHPLGP